MKPIEGRFAKESNQGALTPVFWVKTLQLGAATLTTVKIYLDRCLIHFRFDFILEGAVLTEDLAAVFAFGFDLDEVATLALVPAGAAFFTVGPLVTVPA